MSVSPQAAARRCPRSSPTSSTSGPATTDPEDHLPWATTCACGSGAATRTGGDLVDFTVAVEEGEVVLDVIHRLQATQVGDLAVRWNCKAGKCGSCSAEINGRPRLMCMTRLTVFEPERDHHRHAAAQPSR